MTIEAYLQAMKERFVTDPIIMRLSVIRERSTLGDGYLRARIIADDRASAVLATPASCLRMSPHALRVPAALATTAKTPNGVNMCIGQRS